MPTEKYSIRFNNVGSIILTATRFLRCRFPFLNQSSGAGTQRQKTQPHTRSRNLPCGSIVMRIATASAKMASGRAVKYARHHFGGVYCHRRDLPSDLDPSLNSVTFSPYSTGHGIAPRYKLKPALNKLNASKTGPAGAPTMVGGWRMLLTDPR